MKKGSIPDELRDQARSRTKNVTRRLDAAMVSMELEINNNEGIYPFNGGRASKAEVCRRAGVNKVTLQGKAHRYTTNKRIDAWLEGLKSKMLVGAKAVRSTITDRADGWKEMYLQAVRQTDLYRIDSLAQEQLLTASIKTVEKLEKEVADLRAALSNGKVVSIRRKTKA